MTTDPDFNGQPHSIVERDGVRYTLLGTAHVSKASLDAVRAAIDAGGFDAIAVELDAQRLQSLTDPEALAKLDLVKVIRDGKVALFAANLGLAAYQRRLAEQLGIEPGAELKAAATEAQARNLPLHLIDRDVGTTFRRVSAGLGWWARAKLGAGLVTSLFVSDDVGEDEIEKLKQGDMLEASFGEFAKDSPALYSRLIDERDQYMAARLRATSGNAKTVLAVVGAGHLQGLARYLREDARDPTELCAELDFVAKKRRIPWFTLILTALVVGGIAWGVHHGGFALGADLLRQWVLYTAGFTALGALLAGATVLIHGAGWLEGGLTVSFEKLITDLEVMQTFAELCQPTPNAEADLAFEALREVAPGGHFFAAAHTMERYRTAFYQPLVADWSNFGTWTERGAKDANVRASALWQAIVKEPPAAFLAADTLEALDAFIAGREAEAVLAVAIGALLASPVSWSHHWVWCVPLGMSLYAARRRVALALAGVVFWFAPLTLSPLGALGDAPRPAWVARCQRFVSRPVLLMNLSPQNHRRTCSRTGARWDMHFYFLHVS